MSELEMEGLLKAIQEVLPSARFAPEEAWLEEGQNAKKPSNPVIFIPVCSCGDKEEPASVTVFLKATLSGQHYNIVKKVEKRIAEWVRANCWIEGCGMCDSGLTIDVRLFRIDNASPRFPNAEEEDGEE